MTRAALVSTAAIFFAAPAWAEPVAYQFDRPHTEIRATWLHFGWSNQSIEFTNYEGELMLDFDEPANSSVDVTFNLVDDGFWVGAHEQRFFDHLNSPDLFNTAEFPSARFVATGFETEDGTTGVMSGDLTLMGETHPVSLDVTLNRRSPHPFDPTIDVAGFTATGTVMRSEWGLDLLEEAGVSDEVAVTINAELRASSPEGAEE